MKEPSLDSLKPRIEELINSHSVPGLPDLQFWTTDRFDNISKVWGESVGDFDRPFFDSNDRIFFSLPDGMKSFFLSKLMSVSLTRFTIEIEALRMLLDEPPLHRRTKLKPQLPSLLLNALDQEHLDCFSNFLRFWTANAPSSDRPRFYHNSRVVENYIANKSTTRPAPE